MINENKIVRKAPKNEIETELIAISKKGMEILDLARPRWKSAQLKIEHLLANQIDNLRSNLGRLHHL